MIFSEVFKNKVFLKNAIQFFIAYFGSLAALYGFGIIITILLGILATLTLGAKFDKLFERFM